MRDDKEGDWLPQGSIRIVTGRPASFSDGVRRTLLDSILAAPAKALGIMISTKRSVSRKRRRRRFASRNSRASLVSYPRLWVSEDGRRDFSSDPSSIGASIRSLAEQNGSSKSRFTIAFLIFRRFSLMP